MKAVFLQIVRDYIIEYRKQVRFAAANDSEENEIYFFWQTGQRTNEFKPVPLSYSKHYLLIDAGCGCSHTSGTSL